MPTKRRHITVSVTQELYHETRLLAAEYDTTVTDLVTYLLTHMRDALRRANYRKPQKGSDSVSPAGANG